LFFNRSKIKLEGIPDGTSNTMAFGEGLGAFSKDSNMKNTGTRERLWSWMGAGAMVTYWGVKSSSEADWFTFGSRHTSGANFAFGDGSVRTVRYGTYAAFGTARDWWVLQQVSGRGDGFIEDTSGVTN
jgi:prepilin-type processing-associated H-X9-DG protein